MKAMVLAAGLGTRLRPLTNDRPKALVELHGRTLLDITLARLRDFGIRDVIINVHHFADLVIDYLHANANFGMHIEISHENLLLDTGGGLKKAADFFLQDRSEEPFVLHNVDVLSSVDLKQMVQQHQQTGALATLSVRARESSRQLLFDLEGSLCGRRTGRNEVPELAREIDDPVPLAFDGIHVISPRLLRMITEEGAFPIIPVYLRLATQGEMIQAFRSDQYYWRDLGNIESLQRAESEWKT